MRIWPHFNGFGFNLHAEKGKQGQFIGKVDEDSPSEAAGLRKGDRIIEVNDVSVVEESHSEVVSRIKTVPNVVRMLVIDPNGEQWYKDRGITIQGDMPNVIVGESEVKAVQRDPSPEPAPVLAAAAVHAGAKPGNAFPCSLRFRLTFFSPGSCLGSS